MESTSPILLAIADAHEAAAKSLRRHALQYESAQSGISPDGGFDTALAAFKSLHPQAGHRQVEIIALLEDAGHDGSDTGRLSRTMDYDQPNVHLTLQALMRHGFVVRDSTASPHIYRLSDELLGKGPNKT